MSFSLSPSVSRLYADILELAEVVPNPVSLEEVLLTELLHPEKSHRDEHPHRPILTRILKTLVLTQKYLAYTITCFLGLHLTLVIAVPGLGAPLSVAQEVFEMARNVYHGMPYFEELAIMGAAGIHIVSGIGIRWLRATLRPKKRPHKATHSADGAVITDLTRDDIGLGGIASVVGLGYRRLWISKQFPTVSPLAFLGYILVPLVAYHFAKFRLAPCWVDGDLSLVNLNYVTHYLGESNLGYSGCVLNTAALSLLVWTGLYHATSGMLRFTHKFGANWKRLGYVVINGGCLVALVAVYRMRSMGLDLGFMGRQFSAYARRVWV